MLGSSSTNADANNSNYHLFQDDNHSSSGLDNNHFYYSALGFPPPQTQAQPQPAIRDSLLFYEDIRQHAALIVGDAEFGVELTGIYFHQGEPFAATWLRACLLPLALPVIARRVSALFGAKTSALVSTTLLAVWSGVVCCFILHLALDRAHMWQGVQPAVLWALAALACASCAACHGGTDYDGHIESVSRPLRTLTLQLRGGSPPSQTVTVGTLESAARGSGAAHSIASRFLAFGVGIGIGACGAIIQASYAFWSPLGWMSSLLSGVIAAFCYACVGLGLADLLLCRDAAAYFHRVTSPSATWARFHLRDKHNLRCWLALRSLVFSATPHERRDMVFSWCIAANAALFAAVFAATNGGPRSQTSAVAMLHLACASAYSAASLVCMLQVNRVFKDTSALRAEKVRMALAGKDDKQQDTLQQVADFVVATESSVKLFGNSISDGFVHLSLSLLLSGMSTCATRFFVT